MPSDPLNAMEKVQWDSSWLRSWIGSISLPRFLRKRQDLRIGCMGDTKIPKLETFPVGFPRVACFLDSDDSFMLFKRFGIVFSRLLLNKQDEIREMEDELQGMDKTYEANGCEEYLRSRNEGDRKTITSSWTRTRPELLEKLETKILQYSELLLKAHQLKGLEKPSARDYRSVLNYMENDGGQMFEQEMSWIYDKEDLVSLRPGREHAWLDGLLERLLKLCRCGLVKYIFCTPVCLPLPSPNACTSLKIAQETNARTDDPAIHYYDRRRISKCVTFLITILILVLLMTPIWLLYKSSVNGTIGKTTHTIVLILAFTLIFSAALSAFTKAKRHEIVAASAGSVRRQILFSSLCQSDYRTQCDRRSSMDRWLTE
ncbi:MAG: hypothetical protein L6R40_006002 [Gallowayella cf. fulva]|nr:MAG: hypothetical protein L6R40_006002 [Xanthomendoza cf. fulva]